MERDMHQKKTLTEVFLWIDPLFTCIQLPKEVFTQWHIRSFRRRRSTRLEFRLLFLLLWREWTCILPFRKRCYFTTRNQAPLDEGWKINEIGS